MLEKYKTYLFDLDDTLLDFRASEALAFRRIIENLHNQGELKTELDYDTLYAYYKVENKKLWDLFDCGKVDKDTLKVKRFDLLIKKFNLKASAEDLSDSYLHALPDAVVLLDHAIEVLKFLKERAEIGIITNGIEFVQHKRIERSGIKELVDFVCVSEACGHAKPDIRFFEYAAIHARDFKKENAVIIGDRYEADIVGGHRFGIDTCWFNHDELTIERPIHTYEIRSLKDLYTL